MPLNDVWKKANQQIGFYTSETFDKVPISPGVYAWFYPLRITTKSINDFIDQVNIVFNYDSVSRGKPICTTQLDFNWETINITAGITDPTINISNFIQTWGSLCNSDKFENFRKIIMKSSIFLPPLYVGKTLNLYNRCYQHINGNGKNNTFHSRFENYAREIPNL